MAVKIRYDLIGAYNAGITEHPQKDIEKLGVKILSYEGVPIADCVIMEIDHLPVELPSFITILNDKTPKPDWSQTVIKI